MTKLFSSLFAVLVASATTFASAQAPAKPAPATANTGSGPAIEAKVAMCIGCHGIPGYQSSFPEVHRVPMITGQGAKYIASALTAYKNGDRKHPTMKGIGAGLSDADITQIAAWYEAQGKGAPAPADQPRQPDAQTAALLQKGGCVACHGANFSKPIDPSYPKIAGQHKDYLFVALKAYKAEGSNVVGRSNGVMGGVVKQFSNAELKAIANYVGSLDGELSVHPQSRFR